MEITINKPTATFKRIFNKLSKGYAVVEYQPDDSPESAKTIKQLKKNCGDIGLELIEKSEHFYLVVNSNSIGYIKE